MMPPTIGRLVHYYWCTADTEQLVPFLGGRETEPYAAMVTGTHEDGATVDLWIFPKPADTVRGKFAAVCRAKYSEAPKAGCWRWPPMAKPGAYAAPEHCPPEAATATRT